MAANGTEIGTRVQAQLAWKGRGDALLVVVDRLVALLGFVIPAGEGSDVWHDENPRVAIPDRPKPWIAIERTLCLGLHIACPGMM